MSHDHHHHNDKDLESESGQVHAEEFDTAGKSLSDALRISFVILKVIMIILVVAFLASGFKTIGSEEVGLLLRFGRFVPVGEDRVIGPGAKWVFPYPIDEVVKIPIKRKVNIPINSFWYYQTQAELLNEGSKKSSRIPPKLDPIKDGYTLTHGDDIKIDGRYSTDGSDYNIAHTRWQLTYQIDDAEVFFRNVYIDVVKPGDLYFEVITKNIEPLLRNIFEDAVVTTMVNYTIDEVLFERVAGVTDDVRELIEKKLSAIESGIKVVSVQLVDKMWPRQVDQAFQESISVRQTSQEDIAKARTNASNLLSEAAGPVAEELFTAINDPNMSEVDKELLWSRLSGLAQNEIYEADAYRTTVAKNAEANADYLKSLLPEYRKRPELVLQRIYFDTLENVFANADEIIAIESSDRSAGEELRVLMDRDNTIKKKKQDNAATTTKNDSTQP